MPIEITENLIRIRVRDPNDFKEGSFRTIDISKPEGIQSVIGRLKKNDKVENQNFMFDKKKWTVDRARKWVEDHGHTVMLHEAVGEFLYQNMGVCSYEEMVDMDFNS